MNIDELNKICKDSFIDYIGITFTKYRAGYVSGTIELAPHHLQPAGVVHGGVYISLAETLAGAGSMLLVGEEGKIAFGTAVNSHHIASAKGGEIIAEAELIYKGIFKHIWDVKISDRNGKLISMSRVTNSIKENEGETLLLNQNGNK